MVLWLLLKEPGYAALHHSDDLIMRIGYVVFTITYWGETRSIERRLHCLIYILKPGAFMSSIEVWIAIVK